MSRCRKRMCSCRHCSICSCGSPTSRLSHSALPPSFCTSSLASSLLSEMVVSCCCSCAVWPFPWPALCPCCCCSCVCGWPKSPPLGACGCCCCCCCDWTLPRIWPRVGGCVSISSCSRTWEAWASTRLLSASMPTTGVGIQLSGSGLLSSALCHSRSSIHGLSCSTRRLRCVFMLSTCERAMELLFTRRSGARPTTSYNMV
mmetsp:Transcript_13006/g.36637  ORF Transcript_13006/g.36637 Transcript_13006/m.36637 type:complete len:201 (+) Transcript_13006:416-1018(+)